MTSSFQAPKVGLLSIGKGENQVSLIAAVRTDGGPARSYSILAPGFAKWWGSDARALAQAFRRLGHSVIDIDAEDYVSWRCQGLAPKVMRRLFGRVWIDDYNQAVLKQASSSSYDFILVFKGNLLKSETVAQLKGTARPLYNVYPDVSFEDHGPDIPAALRLYDCVFTTKSYHGEAEIRRFGIQNLQHVRHGFDPDVHRPVPLSGELVKHYASDVSFVGCWSPEKEEKIANLLKRCAPLTIKVYGMGWHYASSEFKRRMGPNLKAGVFGDELSIVYCASRVNLGLLSCSKSDATLCDQTTARTFQIPATGSFMLHEDTPEVRTFFEDGREVELFNNNEELIEKVEMALSSPGMAKDIRKRGYERCRREPYDYSSTAQNIINYYEGTKKKGEIRRAEVMERSTREV